nr:hypothetical protein [Escherichia coli]
MDHAVRPVNVSDVNLVVLGRNPVNSIRKAHGLPLTNLPVLIGNCLHINTGSLYMSEISSPALLAPVYSAYYSSGNNTGRVDPGIYTDPDLPPNDPE